MNPLTQSKNATILPVLIALTLGCFGLSPQAQAVCQEGCLTNANTALADAIFRTLPEFECHAVSAIGACSGRD